MKLSEQTIAILKNAADINPSLFIKGGNLQKTRAVAGNIHMEFTSEESFPQDFGVWDLPSLISMLTLFEDAEIEFGDFSLTINKDESQFEFFAANEEIVKPVTSSIPTYKSLFEFQLSSNDIKTIKKTSGILKAKAISFIGDGKEVYLSVGDHTTSTKNTYRQLLGTSDNVFAYHLDISVFKIIDSDYKVNIAKTRRFIHIASEVIDLDYVLACLSDSSEG